MTTALRWPEDVATIIEWARGGTVNVAQLVVELDAVSDHFASSAALWPDSTAERLRARTGPT